jgi:hypothetical protein
MNLSDFKKVPIAEASQLPEEWQFCEILRNRYWVVTEDECLLFYQRGGGNSPQCNSNEAIAAHIMKSTRNPGVKIVFIPVVYRRHNCRDYV